MKNRIGIMGGTFNPIHIGHLILAEHAYEQFKLSKVLIMPSKNPPHKNKDEILDDFHRVNMIKRAILSNKNFEFSSMELNREGITYTADTLNELKAQNRENEYYFIIGADSLFKLETWYKPSQIISSVHIVAAVRHNIPNTEMQKQCDILNKKYSGDIKLLDSPNIDISSKDIRIRISEGKSIRYFVPDGVFEYIHENSLYNTCTKR